MTTNENSGSGGLLGRIASALTSVGGITTAVATIMTSVTAILGVVAHHQAAQLRQAHRVVALQARQIRQLQSSPAATVPARPAAHAAQASGVSSTSAPGSMTHYLSGLTPTVDNQVAETGQQVIAAKPYPKSIYFYCSGGSGDQPSEAYDVAGSSAFTALVGIADNEENVTGVIATVTFTNEGGQQLGKPVQVSLGHPVKVTLDITGITQLGITCNGRDAHTSQAVDGFHVALGDAGVS